MTGPALRSFFRIAAAWGLKEHELIPKSADDLVHKPNKAQLFGRRPALERMASGNVADLYEVRQYINAQRG